MKNIVILGSTGTIGINALDVVRRHKNRFRVLGLAANQNAELILRQIREFKPKVVALQDSGAARSVQNALSGMRNAPSVWNHSGGVERVARHAGADVVLCGMVGASGLLPLIAAVKAGKTVGLANKEALVIGGELIRRLVQRHKATLIPVDSEHSAIFHCLEGNHHRPIKRLILTASGGPFYRNKKDLAKITVEEALRHPTWKMGAKITVDSATLMNKGLEAIEAHYLFGVPMEKISILIHPESIVHSLVEFEDGALLAQLSHPDMRIPIQYALTHPDRIETSVRRLKLEEVRALHFDRPDFSRFPCLRLALAAGEKGGTAPAALSSANEEAVRAFINKEIRFTDIAAVSAAVLKKHKVRNQPTLEDVLAIDRWARNEARQFMERTRKIKI